MTKKIETLATDIYSLLGNDNHFEPTKENLVGLAENMGGHIVSSLSSRSSSRELGKLWFSELGEKCLRKMWYKFHEPDKAESMAGHTYFKFLYGDTIEELVVMLAKEAGHKVERTQERVEYEHKDTGWRVTGRVDAVIDGTLVDVKSASSFAFKRYREGITSSTDSFGYIHQLSGYHRFLTPSTKEAGFVWVDKQNGTIAYTPVVTESKEELDARISDIAHTLDCTTATPTRGFMDVPDGKSGNRKLDIACSYCSFKNHCWADANGGQGIRTFIYSYGPSFLTQVSRVPKVNEVAT